MIRIKLLLLSLSLLSISTVSTTVPASPEQSNSTGPCPLDIPNNLLTSVASSCSADPSPLLCCPLIAAWLYSTHAAALLTARNLSLPLPLDDFELCVAAAEAVLQTRGVVDVGADNVTCDVVECYCGVRLHPLSCPGMFVPAETEGRWVFESEDMARRLESECGGGTDIDGCNRCLKALYLLRNYSNQDSKTRYVDSNRWDRSDRDCQLMGLTWLLAKDRARYLPISPLVIRAFMMSPDVYPESCTVSGMPIPLDMFDLDASSAVGLDLPLRDMFCALFVALIFISIPLEIRYKR